MHSKIIEAFDNLEKKISLYVEKNQNHYMENKQLKSSLDIEKHNLLEKNKELQESKQTVMEVAKRLHHVISTMKSILKDNADQRNYNQ